MAISLPSEDSAQFFTWRDWGLDAVKENIELKAMTSSSAKVEVCHNVTIKLEVTDITVLLERNIAAMDFPMTRDDCFGRNLKGLDKFVKKMAFSSAPQRNK